MQTTPKKERIASLKKLIGSGRYGEQEKLLAALRAEGHTTTQATLSRDLAQLGAIKRDGRYTIDPIGLALNGQSKVMSMTYVAPNLIVVRTTPGLAQAAARLMDDFAIAGVGGTVAGDDTIFVAIDPDA